MKNFKQVLTVSKLSLLPFINIRKQKIISEKQTKITYFGLKKSKSSKFLVFCNETLVRRSQSSVEAQYKDLTLTV